jgi:hypothetical protein
MGAYGSPELPSKNSDNGYNYSYGNYQKPKGEKGGCLKNVFIAAGLFFVFFVVYGLASTIISGGSPRTKDGTVQVMASAPASSAPVVVDDSTDFLQAWSKAAVLKALIYPDSAKFSDNPSDWNIVRDGNICEIHSVVSARGKETKKVSPTSFIVKISYDDLNAQVVYISLGDQVCYDSTKPSKGK